MIVMVLQHLTDSRSLLKITGASPRTTWTKGLTVKTDLLVVQTMNPGRVTCFHANYYPLKHEINVYLAYKPWSGIIIISQKHALALKMRSIIIVIMNQFIHWIIYVLNVTSESCIRLCRHEQYVTSSYDVVCIRIVHVVSDARKMFSISIRTGLVLFGFIYFSKGTYHDCSVTELIHCFFYCILLK